MEPGGGRFLHTALFYNGAGGFAPDTAEFVREGLDGDEAVLVAVSEERSGPLREELGDAARRVRFLALDEVGNNPARILPAWQDWVDRNAERGRAFRGVSEPVWPGRSELEIRECLLHEHLLNTAFDPGPAWSLLCVYDASQVAPQVLRGASLAHPVIVGGAAAPEPAPFDPNAGLAAFAQPLPELGPPLFEASFGLDDLRALRSAVRRHADRLRLTGRSLEDFQLVADELACNSVLHGGGRGRLAFWAADGHAVCEVRDRGLISDPLTGRRRPDLRAKGNGAGLWTANRLCDLLLIHSTPAKGTAVRAYLATR